MISLTHRFKAALGSPNFFSVEAPATVCASARQITFGKYPVEERWTPTSIYSVQVQLARNDLLGEIAFADEERHDEDPRREDTPQNLPDVRFLLPKKPPAPARISPAASIRRRRRRAGAAESAFTVEPCPMHTSVARLKNCRSSGVHLTFLGSRS